jgi:hypothetical protein
MDKPRLERITVERADVLIDAVVNAKTAREYDAAREYLRAILMRAWETHG